MGQAGFTVAGQVVGAYFGGPWGAMAGGMIGSYIGGALYPTDLGRKEGPRLSDLRSQVSTYGASIPVIYGRSGPAGCVIWADDIREVSVEEDIGTKGQPATEGTSVTYSYYASFAVAICQGEMASLSRIWVNGKCFYDVRDESDSEALTASAAFAEFFTWYPGSETQEPDPTMEAALGAGNVPAYRGVCYLVFHDVPLELFHNAPIGALNCQFEVTRVCSPTSGLRSLESGAMQNVNLIYPVVGGVVRARNLNIAGGRTDVFRFDATPISQEPETADEDSWPGPNTGGTNGVMLTADSGFYVRASTNPETLFSSAAVELYAQQTPSGVLADAMGLFVDAAAAGEFYMGCVPCADRVHVMVFARVAGSGNMDKYYLIKWNVSSTAWEMVSSGAANPGEVNGHPIGSASQNYGYKAGCLESDLTHLWVINGQSNSVVFLYAINAVSGALEKIADWEADPTTSAGSGCTIWADGAMAWCVLTNASGNYRMFTRMDGTGANTEDLADVVTDVCERCGLSTAQIDVTDLAGISVDGFMWAGVIPGRAALEHLRRVYWFDPVETSGKIKFILRGGDPVETITADYLGASEGGDPVLELVKTERADEDTLPAFLSVSYLTKDADYQPGVQSAQRSATVSEQPSTIELPMVLSDTDARRIADVLLYDGWLGRNRRTWATTRAFAHLEPADIVTLEPDDATSYEVRITSIRHGDGMIAFEGVDEDAAVYDQTSLGGTIEDEAPLVIAGPTRAVLLDIPALLDSDDDPGYYAAAAGYLPSWPGARLFRSDDDGANYTSATVFFDAAVIGYAYIDTLGDYTGGNFYDASNTLRVSLLSGSLTSVTDAQLLAGANAAAIGNPTDGWEIVQFRDVAYSGGIYTLSMLLRGRKGTEHKQATHVAGEIFVLLTVAGLQRLADSVGALNSERIYRAVTFGQRLADASPQTFTNTGLALECYSPVHPAAIGWGGDLTLSWIRRGRIVNGWNDGIDVPLSEDSEAYEVDIYDAGNSTVLRTLTSATQSVSYTSAQQTTDFGAPVTSLNLRIYQMSADVGRGTPCIVTLTD